MSLNNIRNQKLHIIVKSKSKIISLNHYNYFTIYFKNYYNIFLNFKVISTNKWIQNKNERNPIFFAGFNYKMHTCYAYINVIITIANRKVVNPFILLVSVCVFWVAIPMWINVLCRCQLSVAIRISLTESQRSIFKVSFY